MTDNPIVYIVDDDASVREGLTQLLESADFAVSTFPSAKDFLDGWTRGGPACLLLDVRLPELSGLDLQERLNSDGRNLPIIFMTGYGTIPMTVKAMRAGAVEFLTKPIDDAVLLEAVRAALERDRLALAQTERHAALRKKLNSLTPRELEVMQLAIGGLMNKQLAAALGTSEITAKVHKRRVMEKMGARTLVDLVHMAETLEIAATAVR
jgi:FixJ family two-component response regulator